MTINVTTARRYASRLFEVLSPVQVMLFALGVPCGIYSMLAQHLSPLAAPLGLVCFWAGVLAMALVFVQGLALAFCDFLRRNEFTMRAAEQQKICEAREKKGFRSFKGNGEGRRLSMRERAKLFDAKNGAQ